MPFYYAYFFRENVRCLKWHPLVEPGLLLAGAARFTREEQLQWERKRLATWGITSYELHVLSGKLVFPAASTLYHCTDTGFGVGTVLYFCKFPKRP